MNLTQGGGGYLFPDELLNSNHSSFLAPYWSLPGSGSLRMANADLMVPGSQNRDRGHPPSFLLRGFIVRFWHLILCRRRDTELLIAQVKGPSRFERALSV